MQSEDLPDERTPGIGGEDEAALEQAMRETPRGAVAVSGLAVALLMLCWFAIYLFVFLPRGSVG